MINNMNSIYNPELKKNFILDPLFQFYRKGLIEFIQRSPSYLKTINATEGGALFGDGIYSLEVFARSSLPNGELENLVRGTDIYLSTTPPNDQRVVLDLEKIDNNPVSENWILENTSFLIILGLVFTLILSAVGVLLISRNSEFE